MTQVTDEQAHEILVNGAILVSETLVKHGPSAVPMIISGLLAVCSQIGALSMLKESFEAAVDTIEVMEATTEAETASKQ